MWRPRRHWRTMPVAPRDSTGGNHGEKSNTIGSDAGAGHGRNFARHRGPAPQQPHLGRIPLGRFAGAAFYRKLWAGTLGLAIFVVWFNWYLNIIAVDGDTNLHRSEERR